MQAGHELDAMVAENVMGWKPWRSKHGYWYIDRPDGESLSTFGKRDYTARFDSITGAKLPDVQWWEDCWEIPCYSTDIAAAWEVVNKMRFMVWPTSEGWGAGTGVYDHDIWALAATAPLAICWAALKVVHKS